MIRFIRINNKMNITLYFNDVFETVFIYDASELPLLIYKYFEIPVSQQVIKLHDEVFTDQPLHKHDLLYIYKREVSDSYPHIHILAESSGHQFRCIIDSGAQTNVMSHTMANLLKLSIDTRMQGIAKGVGSTKIIGQVKCHLMINQIGYDLAFRVIETEQEPTTKYLMLIGLSFLVPHQCNIDFVHKTLTIKNNVVHLMNHYQTEQLIVPIKQETPIEKCYRNLQLNLDEHVMLKKILCNIVQHPNEEKYKCINTSGMAYQKISRCEELMHQLGFVKIDKQLKFTNNIDTLNNLIAIMA